MSMRIRVAEDQHAYFRDFASNHSWDYLFNELDIVIQDMQKKAAYADEKHQYHKGEWQGALYIVQYIQDILAKAKG